MFVLKTNVAICTKNIESIKLIENVILAMVIIYCAECIKKHRQNMFGAENDYNL